MGVFFFLSKSFILIFIYPFWLVFTWASWSSHTYFHFLPEHNFTNKLQEVQVKRFSCKTTFLQLLFLSVQRSFRGDYIHTDRGDEFQCYLKSYQGTFCVNLVHGKKYKYRILRHICAFSCFISWKQRRYWILIKYHYYYFCYGNM